MDGMNYHWRGFASDRDAWRAHRRAKRAALIASAAMLLGTALLCLGLAASGLMGEAGGWTLPWHHELALAPF